MFSRFPTLSCPLTLALSLVHNTKDFRLFEIIISVFNIPAYTNAPMRLLSLGGIHFASRECVHGTIGPYPESNVSTGVRSTEARRSCAFLMRRPPAHLGQRGMDDKRAGQKYRTKMLSLASYWGVASPARADGTYLAQSLNKPDRYEPTYAPARGHRNQEREHRIYQHADAEEIDVAVLLRQDAERNLRDDVPVEEGTEDVALNVGVPGELTVRMRSLQEKATNSKPLA